MSAETVREYLKRFGADGRILEFSVSSATVELAAEAIGCTPGQIAKTMAFGVGGGCVLIVAAGDRKIDNQKFKAEFAEKAKMLPPAEVEQQVGHAVGGVCPFAVLPGVRVFLDESVRRFETVYPACGSSNSAIGLTPEELECFSAPEKWVDVCKPMMPPASSV